MMGKHLSTILIVIVIVLALIGGWGSRAQESQPVWTEPVNGAVREVFLAFYEYDRNLPLQEKVELVRDEPLYKVYRVAFSSTHEQRVPAYFFTPTKAKRPMPCILVLHGYGGSKNDLLQPAVITALTLSGCAGFAIDAVYHGDRQVAGKELYSQYVYQGRDAVMQTVVDCRRAIDFLQMRPEIDPNRIALVGGSMGGILGGILAGVEKRIKATALIVGGADWAYIARLSEHPAAVSLRKKGELDYERLGQIMAPADPINFVDLISPRPLLMLNGKKDTIVPAAAAQRMFDVAKEPKEIVWYDSGHALPVDQMAKKLIEWMTKNL